MTWKFWINLCTPNILDGSRKRKIANSVDVDVNEIEIPAGNWQLVVKHVPKGSYVFVRLATGMEVRESIISPYRQEVSENTLEPESSNDLG